MAAYDLVLAKMKSIGAVSLPANVSAKVSKKKRKQPEPDAAPASAAAQQPATEPLIDKQTIKKDKKRKKAKAAAATSTETSTESSLQGTVLPKVVVQVTSVLEPAPAQQPRNRHVGRYHKTAAAKKAGSYSKSDLAAILGVDSFPTAAPMSVTAAAQSPEEQVCSRLLTIEHCILSAMRCFHVASIATSMLHSSSHIPSYVLTETGASAVAMHSMRSRTYCLACYQCFACHLVTRNPPCHATSQAICSAANAWFCILQESSEDTTFQPQDAAASPSGKSSSTQSWSSRQSCQICQCGSALPLYMCASV